MERLYEAAALAFGMLTLVLLTVIAMWLGDRDAVRLMVGCIIASYLCQVATAYAVMAVNDGKPRSSYRWLGVLALSAWAASVILGGWAAALMVM